MAEFDPGQQQQEHDRQRYDRWVREKHEERLETPSDPSRPANPYPTPSEFRPSEDQEKPEEEQYYI